jgi:hypothetical protein
MRSDLAATCILISLGSTGCATIVIGTDSNTYLDTTPQHAHCDLQGHKFDAVVTTPAGVTLPASAAPIEVTCKASGYRQAIAKLDTSIDGWIAGNLLIGGMIGLIVDSATGAGRKFPPKLTLVLEPETFASAAERDKWYAGREGEVQASADQAIETKNRQCANLANPAAACQASIEALKRDRDAEIEQLEQRRKTAQIGASTTGVAPAAPATSHAAASTAPPLP